MGAYEYISGIALLVYVFMLLILLNAKQSKIRNLILGMLTISILWTGGSLFMRKLFFPSYLFWYQVSLFGLLALPIVYFRFLMEYIHDVKRWIIHIYTLILLGVFVGNVFTDLFIPAPSVLRVNGSVVISYDGFTWASYILALFVAGMVSHMVFYFAKRIKQDPRLLRSSRPIIIGLLIMFVGNILILFPIFSKFPVDILSGLFNSIALLIALSKRQPFKMKMIFSESIGYAICLVLAFMTLYVLDPIIILLLEKVARLESRWVVWYLGIFSVLLVGYFLVWKQIIVGSFIKDEEVKTELLNQFSADITKTLDTNQIFIETIKVIEQIAGRQRVYFSVLSGETYSLAKSNQPLADLSIVLRRDNPLVKRLIQKKQAVSLQEFKYDSTYQTMWDREKYDLSKLEITHAFGMLHDRVLYGMIFISDTHSRKKLKQQQMLQLEAISTMVSIALKNAASYEQAIIESRTDDLTGLYKRKYFYKLIDDTYSKEKDTTFALVLLNLDDFKLYNQLYGETSADRALVVIADVLKRSVGETGHVARFSGKEFALILPRIDVYKTLQMVDTIKKEMVSAHNHKLIQKLLTFSIGICVYPYGATSVKELIENVQQAVYQVKRNGKNAVRVFDTFVQNETVEKPKDYNSIYNEYKSTIFALTAAIDAKDHYTFSHSDNVAKYAVKFAKKLHLNEDIVENIRQAALLHDIGKISVPEHILNKPARLTETEYKIIQGHVDASIDIIRHLPSLDYVIPAVLGHHEHYDGTGYPRKVSGEDIPITARILCLADSYDAMISRRVYKEARVLEDVLQTILKEAGKQFDPKLAPLFVQMIREDKNATEEQLPVLSTDTSRSQETYNVV